MRHGRIAMLAPPFDDALGLFQAAEDLLLEQFIANFSVEGLA
jgi:hypothetical protein